MNFIPLASLILFIPSSFPAIIMLDTKGLRVGVCFGMTMTVVGFWLKCLINESFYFAMLGQALLASAQPFIQNVPAKLSANWFPKEERILSTSLAAYALVFGVGCGCFIPSIFFP